MLVELPHAVSDALPVVELCYLLTMPVRLFACWLRHAVRLLATLVSLSLGVLTVRVDAACCWLLGLAVCDRWGWLLPVISSGCWMLARSPLGSHAVGFDCCRSIPLRSAQTVPPWVLDCLCFSSPLLSSPLLCTYCNQTTLGVCSGFGCFAVLGRPWILG